MAVSVLSRCRRTAGPSGRDDNSCSGGLLDDVFCSHPLANRGEEDEAPAERQYVPPAGAMQVKEQ